MLADLQFAASFVPKKHRRYRCFICIFRLFRSAIRLAPER